MGAKKEGSKGLPKKFWLIAGIVLAVLIIGATVTAAVLLSDRPAEPDGTEPTVQYDPLMNQVFFNVDRVKYQNEESGLSRRKPEDDGYYHVVFSTDGKRETYRVREKSVVNDIDRKDFTGLVLDDEGIVVGLAPLENVTGGSMAEQFHVVEIDGNKLVTNSDINRNGLEETIVLTDDILVIDVAKEDETRGLLGQVEIKDRIIGYKTTDGKLRWVFVVAKSFNGKVEKGYCKHCDQVVDWRLWTKNNSAPLDNGHYRLMENIVLTAQQSIRQDNHIVVDLNGKTITGGKNKRVYALFEENAGLAIMDTSEDQSGRIVGVGEDFAANGAVLWVRYGLLELYGGTVDASKMTNIGAGGAVYINEGMSMKMYGGRIIGAKTKVKISSAGKVSNGMGGSIYVAGSLEISGGTITGGRTVGHYTGTAWSGGLGGNIFVGSTGNLKMTGGTVTGGTATSGGGNIYDRGTFLLSGGTVSGGRLTAEGKSGGNIVVYAVNDTVFTMTGGSVIGGVAASDGSGGNIWCRTTASLLGGTISGGSAKNGANVYASSGKFTLGGVRISGDVRIHKNADARITGAPKITEGKTYGLLVDSGAAVDVNGIGKGADILLRATGFFTTETSADAANSFRSQCGDVVYVDSKLFAGQVHCLCGSTDGTHDEVFCDGAMLLWEPVWSATSLPSATGCYYLTTDVNPTKQYTIGKRNGTQEDAVSQFLDLNGFKITAAKEKRIWMVTSYSFLGVGDWSEGQKGVAGAYDPYPGANGGLLSVSEGSTFALFGGTLHGREVLKEETGKNDKGEATYSGGYGGALYVSGEALLLGGKVTGGKAEVNGGNINMVAGKKTPSSLLIYNCEIRDGEAAVNGGNIAGSGQVEILSGIVTGGKSVNKLNANILLTAAKDTCLKMSGGQIDGGVRMPNGTQVILSGEPVITGAISGLSLGESTEVTIVGALGEKAMIALADENHMIATEIPENADHFCADGSFEEIYGAKYDDVNKVLYITVVKAHHYGCVCGGLGLIGDHICEDVPWNAWDGKKISGNFYLTEDVNLEEMLQVTAGNTLNLDLNGHTITGAEGLRVFYVGSGSKKATLNICDSAGGGKIVCSNETGNGGLAFLYRNATFNLYGGTLENVGVGGDNSRLVKVGSGSYVCTFNMYGGKLTGGNVNGNGGAVMITNSGSAFYMYGGEITGNTATGNGGGVYVPAGATFQVSGNAKITGNTDSNVYLASSDLKVIGLGENASIGVTAKTLNIGTADTDPAGRLFSDDGNMKIDYNSDTGMLSLSKKGEEPIEPDPVEPGVHVDHCICGGLKPEGHTCKNVEWTPWDGKSTEGSYYLTEDVTVTAMLTVRQNTTLNLDLNGHKITGVGDVRIFMVGSGSGSANLNICDCQGTGEIVSSNETGNGGLALVYRSGTFNLFGGTLKNTGSGANSRLVKVGTSSYVGIFNMYGGKLTGGNVNGNGGGVMIANGVSKFYMYGGEISGNTATGNGGGVYVPVGATFQVSGNAKITGNTPSNVYLPTGAEMKVSGLGENASIGVTTANAALEEVVGTADADPGRKIFCDVDEFQVNFEEGVLKLGEFIAHDDTHCICGGLKPEGHTCKNVEWTPWDGTSTSGTYYLTEDVTLTGMLRVNGGTSLSLDLNGHTITGAEGLRIFYVGSNASKATLNICDCVGTGKLVCSSTEGNGGLVFLYRNATLNLYGGTLEMNLNAPSASGRLVKVGNGSYTCTFNMYGGKLTGGNVDGDGGGVTVANGVSKFYMYGGEISGNTATGNGGGVYNNGGTFQVSGNAKITGNTPGNVYLRSGATMTAVDLGENASVGVTAVDAAIGTSDADPAGKIFSDDAGKEIAWMEEKKELRLQAKIEEIKDEGV